MPQRTVVSPVRIARHVAHMTGGRGSATAGSRAGRRALIAGFGAALLLVVVNVYLAFASYRDAIERIDYLEQIAACDPATLSTADVAMVATTFNELQHDLKRLGAVSSLPYADFLIGQVPWIGPRYDAARQVLQYGQLVASAGGSATTLGYEALVAFETSGVTDPAPPDRATWLDVIVRHESEIRAITAKLDEARAIRHGINDDVLPDTLRAKLAELDARLDDLPVDEYLATHLPALETALGAERPVRYLILFQNSAELRPSGGFPGTAALVTISRGQLVDHVIFPNNILTEDYMRQRSAKLPQPWAIEHYFPQDGFLLHDASWYADFPRSGRQIMDMYAETDWPPIDGVIAVVPDVVGDLLEVTGPITLVVDGVPREFTPDHVHEQIEAQRLRQVDETSTHHKELIGLLGEEIVRRLVTADREAFTRVLDIVIARADRRDIQMYAADPGVQAVLDQHRWSGRLVPDPSVPTVALTFANVALGKSSQLMHSRLNLTMGPIEDGDRKMHLRVDLEHTGSRDVHPFYSGFQRWWVEVTLPDGSRRLESWPAPMPDSESPNGGSYVVELFPGQSGQLEIVFTLPANETLLLRRQPGLTVMRVEVRDHRCSRDLSFSLDRDITLDLDALCSPRSLNSPAASPLRQTGAECL